MNRAKLYKYRAWYWLFKLLMFSTQVLPSRFAYWVALRIADLGYFFGDRGGRKRLLKNLRQVLPNESESRITFEARWVFRNWGKYLCEFLRFSNMDEAYFLRYVSASGLPNVLRALEAGRGCLIMSAHISNWEIGAAYLAGRLGLPVNVLALRHPYGKIDAMFRAQREALGIKVIYTNESPQRVMRALKNNEVVCVLCDRDVTGGGEEIDFFGRPCRFPTGPARFAFATGAALVPGFVLRRSNDSFVVTFSPQLQVHGGARRAARALAATKLYAREVERVISENPEQWPVFYDVWEGYQSRP